MWDKKIWLFSGLVITLLSSNYSYGAISINELDTQEAAQTPLSPKTLPLQPQMTKTQLKMYPAINLWGFTGRHTTAKGQLLWPFCGDNAESAFFGLAEASNSNKQSGWMTGLGAGYRSAINETYLLGGYLIADLNSSANAHGFLIANPGIEMLGSAWDLRVNGYIPLGKKDNWYKGQYYNKQNQRYGWVEEVGPGFDAEIGVDVPYFHDFRIFADTYTFVTSNTDNAVGFGARLDYNFRRYLTFEMRALHDNDLKNTVLVGLRLSIGGFSGIPEHEPLHVTERITDPVEHNLASPGTGYGIPIQNQYVNPW